MQLMATNTVYFLLCIIAVSMPQLNVLTAKRTFKSSLPSSSLTTRKCFTTSAAKHCALSAATGFHSAVGEKAASWSSATIDESRNRTPMYVPCAFVLDIDGVLVNGKRVIAQSAEALNILGKLNIPFICLSNGGGVLEATKAAELSKLLEFPISSTQIQLSHTPMSYLSQRYAKDTVLAIGSGRVKDIAETLGFRDVVTPQMYFGMFPDTLPCRKATGRLCNQTASLPIRAAFILHDPIDWQLDLQVLCDLAMEAPLDIYASNPDIVYSSSHKFPRLAQGAFVELTRSMYQRLTGKEMIVKYFGKPNKVAYEHALNLLKSRVANTDRVSPLDAENSCIPARKSSVEGDDKVIKFGTIYAVGDNPRADVKGANQMGLPWQSVLVRTGVFKGKENDSIDPAHHVFNNLWDAVSTLTRPFC